MPILPTVGALGADPEGTTDTFSHADEHAAPGRYGVTLGPSGVSAQLAVTTRTGLSRFTFPRTAAANVLFKVAGSANPVIDSSVHLEGHDGISGEVESGQFCGTGTNYTLYFAATFNRPFTSAGSWNGPVVSPGVTSCAGADCGAYVTFDARSDQSVLMKVGISFVSIADAADNLRVEDPGWSLGRVESRATGQWNALLDRVRVGGGTAAEQRTFYTALYHSLLDPDVVSDDNGEYTGERRTGAPGDRRGPSTPTSPSGTSTGRRSNWSPWWPHARPVPWSNPWSTTPNRMGGSPSGPSSTGDESQMNGDSADPIIADAYAFGVRDFDVSAALAAMVKGATETETGHGFEIERQYLDQYLSQHYVNADSLDLTSIDYSIGGSVTLEYAIDDFSIAQVAQASGTTRCTRR